MLVQSPIDMKQTLHSTPSSHNSNSNEAKITPSAVETKTQPFLHSNETSQGLQEHNFDSKQIGFTTRGTCHTILSNETSSINIVIKDDENATGYQKTMNKTSEHEIDYNVAFSFKDDSEDPTRRSQIALPRYNDESNQVNSSSFLQPGEHYENPLMKTFHTFCCFRCCCCRGNEGCCTFHSCKERGASNDQRNRLRRSSIEKDKFKNNCSANLETESTTIIANNHSYRSRMNVASTTVRTGHALRMSKYSTYVIAVVIVLLGTLASIGFVTVGLMSQSKQISDEFHNYATTLTHNIYDSLEEYVRIASFVHLRCRNHKFSRDDFTELYQTIRAGTTLGFKAIQFVPFVPHSKRGAYEEEIRTYLKDNYPNISYQGFIGFNELNSTKPEIRTNQSFYFPNHYVEPVAGNEVAIDLDIYSSLSRIRAINDVYFYKKPIMSDRINLVQSDPNRPGTCGDHNGPSFAIVIMSPGINVTSSSSHSTTSISTPNEHSVSSWPRDIVSISICIPDLLLRSTATQFKSATMYIHDLSHANEGLSGVFLGGIRLEVHKGHNPKKENILEDQIPMSLPSNISSSRCRTVKFVDEILLNDLRQIEATAGNGISRTLLHHEQIISVANRIWSVTIITDEVGQFGAAAHQILPLIIVCGVILLLASIAVGAWVLYHSRRLNQLNAIQMAADQERTSLILENAKRATEAERELNDFLAHEVRNPVAAAIAACSFLKMELFKDNPAMDEQSKQIARDDVSIIDNSLNFVNDLLRNMLDMHRATVNKLQIDWKPTYVLNDILEPVSAMLHQRDSQKVRIIVECCPTDLCFLTDPIRLKQILLNLGRNSCKFIASGFIRLSAFVDPVSECVVFHVDDSGSGIPIEKRDKLFSKYQSSLDLLSQGTGIGLFLCKKLIDLMDGEIYLDTDYNSGIEGCPGSRFAIILNKKPILDNHDSKKDEGTDNCEIEDDNNINKYQHSTSDLSTHCKSLPSITSPLYDMSTSIESETKLSMDSVKYNNNSVSDSWSNINNFANCEGNYNVNYIEGNRKECQFNVDGSGEGSTDAKRLVITMSNETPSTIPIKNSDEGVGNNNRFAVVQKKSIKFTLPEKLSVLFVDDDPVLRKLFVRSIRNVAPDCIVREAASGEVALRILEEWNESINNFEKSTITTSASFIAPTPNDDSSNDGVAGQHSNKYHTGLSMSSSSSSSSMLFDLIFVDMYMASVNRQMLGTETVSAMRNLGVKSIICGLSANAKEDEFLAAGADAFLFKPFPCKKDTLRQELERILCSGRSC